MTPLGLGLLLVMVVLAWLFVRPRDSDRRADPEIDEAELEAAEDEVRDLPWDSTPESAQEEIPDWGPGAPKT